jgi:hypothetical protein
MRTRLGIGVRAFGVRGGVSTRGFGVGVGPLSAGGSWRRRRRGSSGGGWIGVIAILAAVGWLSSKCSHPQGTQPTLDRPGARAHHDHYHDDSANRRRRSPPRCRTRRAAAQPTVTRGARTRRRPKDRDGHPVTAPTTTIATVAR